MIGLERPLALTYDIHTNMSSSLLSADENTAAQVDLTESVVSTGLDWCHASDWRVVVVIKILELDPLDPDAITATSEF